MTALNSEYQPFFAYLQSLHVHFLDRWVIECVNYFKSIKPGIGVEALKNEVIKQWLLVNLRDIRVPCLPPDLKSREKIILTRTYAVQVESMIDCSEACFSQLRKMLDNCTENVEDPYDPTTEKRWDIKSNRCLTFVISDGVQEIQALEYQPIKKIKTNDPELLPGFKMLIIGPVECRKGMILLKEENVKIYGGEVDALVQSHGLRSLLLKKLELDENDYPDNSSPDFIEDDDYVPQPSSKGQAKVQAKVQAKESHLDEECIESLLSENDDLFLSVSLEAEALAQESKPKSAEKIMDPDEIDMFGEEPDWDKDIPNQLGETSIQKKHSLPQDVPKSTPKRPSLDPDLGDAANKGDSTVLTEVDETPKREKTNQSLLKPKKCVQTKVSSFFKSSNSNPTNPTSDDKTAADSKKSSFTFERPFVYLKHILSRNPNIANVYTVKGIILSLKKKIIIKNDEFSLTAIVSDGSASVDVALSSEILERMLGFSPCEMRVMMKAKEKNTAIAQRVNDSFLKIQEKLISLNCLLKIRFFYDGRLPLVLSLVEVKVGHFNSIKGKK